MDEECTNSRCKSWMNEGMKKWMIFDKNRFLMEFGSMVYM